MNPLEQQLHYPHGDAMPEPGSTMELAPGVRWIRMPLPFALDHINLWLLRDNIDGVDGWVGSFDPLTAFERETLALVLAAAEDDGTGVRLQVFTGEGADRNTWLFAPADIQILRIEVRA